MGQNSVSFLLTALLVTQASIAYSATKANRPPVYETSVDRPYVVLGEIKDNLRKPFAFLADPSKEKIFAELWERGKKMGAEAVIYARFGETRRTLFNHGLTPIAGTAIKYTDKPRAE